MTTSGTTATNFDFLTIAEEAFERCGRELRTGYDITTAQRSMNLLTMEWANRGVNLWTIEQGTIPLVQGTAEYDLPADTIDILDYVVRTGTGAQQSDLTITRVGFSVYATIPNKTTEGRPVQLWVSRKSGATNPSSGVAYPTVTLWPVPDGADTYTLVYWRLRRIQDVDDGVNSVDIPFRFMPALISGLAFYLSQKLPGALERMPILKQEYMEQWQMAADEDRERVPLKIVPRVGRY